MKRIIVHHSLTQDSKTLSWAAIRRYHVHDNGWLDIGYHAGVELVGGEYEALYGRPMDTLGAHTAGANHDSLGICFVGNYDLVEPPPELLAVAARRILTPWCRIFEIPVDMIVPHSDYSHKTCPGKLFDMEDLRSMVGAALT